MGNHRNTTWKKRHIGTTETLNLIHNIMSGIQNQIQTPTNWTHLICHLWTFSISLWAHIIKWLQPTCVGHGSEKRATSVEEQHLIMIMCVFVYFLSLNRLIDLTFRCRILYIVVFQSRHCRKCDRCFSLTDCPGHHPVGADGSGRKAQSPGGGTHTQWVSRTVPLSFFPLPFNLLFFNIYPRTIVLIFTLLKPSSNMDFEAVFFLRESAEPIGSCLYCGCVVT